mgnify:CR=1 FL=1
MKKVAFFSAFLFLCFFIKAQDLHQYPFGFQFIDETLYLVDLTNFSSIDQLMDSGHYELTETQKIIPKHFTKEQDVLLYLFCFDGQREAGWIIKVMDTIGFKPATLQELLALGSSFPGLQQKFPIVALGSTWSNSWCDKMVGKLDTFKFHRQFSWSCRSEGVKFKGKTRFLAVEK